MRGDLKSDVMWVKRGGAEERRPGEGEEGADMQAGAVGGTGGACTIIHKINLKVMRKMSLLAFF